MPFNLLPCTSSTMSLIRTLTRKSDTLSTSSSLVQLKWEKVAVAEPEFDSTFTSGDFTLVSSDNVAFKIESYHLLSAR